MKDNTQNMWEPVLQAFAFALYFVLLAVTYTIWHMDYSVWKVLLSVATGLLLIWFIKKEQFVDLCGFVMLMTGLNLLWQSGDVPVFWKVFGSIAVVLQFGNLGRSAT